MKEDMTKFQFGRTIAGRHEPSSVAALSSDGVFELLNVIDDRRKVRDENGVGGTDAEAGAGQEAAHFITGRGRLSI